MRSSQQTLVIRKLLARIEFRVMSGTPEGSMDELIRCFCGHGIGRHTQYGCEPAARRCDCRRDAGVVLAEATAAVREPARIPGWARPEPGGIPSDVVDSGGCGSTRSV
jgi:hypothetical protein